MKAKLKSGKIIKGKLAETFSRIGLATEIKAGRPVSKKPEKVEKEIPAEEINKVPDDFDMISKVPDNKKFTDKKKKKK